MNYETVLYTVEDGIATITLNRPRVLNAINRQLFAEWRQAFDLAASDPAVRAIVFAGAGRAFSAGHDLKEGAQEQMVAAEAWRRALKDTLDFGFKIWDCGKAVVAAVHGYCLGQALQVTLACDLVLAAEDAVLGEPETRQVTTSAMLLMPWVVGLHKSKELLLLGETVTGRDAERIGLVNRAVPAEQLAAETRGLAERLAMVPPAAIRLNKRAINHTFEVMGLRSAVDYNLEVLALSQSIESGPQASTNFLEVQRAQGLKAALQARDAEFEGDGSGKGANA